MVPQSPVYVVSKGRAKIGTTAPILLSDKVPFRIVVEPQEADDYAESFGKANVLVLPFHNLGQGSIPARNWIWDHAIHVGSERHWILDDNLLAFKRRWQARRMYCNAGIALRMAEVFTERFANVAISGLNYEKFCISKAAIPAYNVNVHVYSCMLIRNDTPIRWRGMYNEDTDLCLQALALGLCTVLLNAFMVQKATSMTKRGGNTEELYRGDGRLKMARSLERVWPHVVKTGRRFRRPQHVIRDSWRRFTTPLQLKEPIDQNAPPNEYGMTLKQITETKSEELRKLFDGYTAKQRA